MQRHVGLKESNLLGELRLIGYEQTLSDDFSENIIGSSSSGLLIRLSYPSQLGSYELLHLFQSFN